MKPIVKTSLIAVTSALIGGALTAGTLNHLDSRSVPKTEVSAPDDMFNNFLKEHKNLRSQFDLSFNNKSFWQDPFKDMWIIQQEFEKRMSSLTNSSNNFSYEIFEREDSQNIYYDIKVPDINSTTIKTDVENGQLTITGTVEKKNESSHSQSSYKSSFQRSFPLPNNVDEHRMEMTTENDKIVLRFPKLTV